jgi:hypothetical protein
MNARHVCQEDQYGCSIAVLAMITGLSYQQVRAEVGFDGTLASSCAYRQKKWLEARGYRYENCYFRASGFDRRADFIPTDQPYLLWLSVGGDTWRHSVLQLADGTILDPDRDGPQRLEAYELQQITVITSQEEGSGETHG